MRSVFKPILSFLFICIVTQGFSQQIGVGHWRDELPYFDCISVADAGTRIYGATPYAIFYFDKEDNSIQRITKITGLSDIGISTINYSPEFKTLVIAYSNANIDLIKNNTIINISDIKRAPILGNKTINDIFFIGKNAYLSCGFGIVVLDIDKEEIRDTYYIGSNGSQVNVMSLVKDQNDTLFAATEKGIYLAPANSPNLANYASWKTDSRMSVTASYTKVAFFSNEVIVNRSMPTGTSDSVYRYKNGHWTLWEIANNSPVKNIRTSQGILMVVSNYNLAYYDTLFNKVNTVYSYFPGNPYPQDVVCDNNQVLWIGDTYSGLVSFDIKTSTTKGYNLNGPLTAGVFSMATMGHNLYIVSGGYDNSYTPLSGHNAEVYQFDGDTWNNLNWSNNAGLTNLYNLVVVAPDPSDSKRFYAGSWGRGLLEFYDNHLVARYTEGNSTLHHHSATPDTSDVRVGGCAFDASGALWVVNTHNNQCLSRKFGNQWTGYNIPLANDDDLGPLLVDRHGQKWIVMRYSSTNPYSLLVFSDNGTPDDKTDDVSKNLNSYAGNGNIPGTIVYAMVEDKDGQIWIGTEKGIGVFYSPENVFTGQSFDAQQILVQQGLYTQYLMENELVTALAVDGANNKWIGTDRGGLYQVSKDGTQQLLHFTVDNSPLFSDRITSLAIDPLSGEVYIGTDKGVLSYKGSATEGGTSNENVFAYPNPVRQDYSGWIAIKGLVSDAQVRITDVAGNLVYSTRAEGGQAIWDGKDYSGHKARTGVYFVYANSDAGNAKVVTKILIIN